jgi:hypothetical protein
MSNRQVPGNTPWNLLISANVAIRYSRFLLC